MRDSRSTLRSWLRAKFRDPRPILVSPYRGYGTPQVATLFGRVLRDPGIPAPEADDSAWENLLATYERLESDEIPGVVVRGILEGMSSEAISDDEGYFELSFQPAQPLHPGWHQVSIEALNVDAASVIGHVLVADAPGIGIISDIDDTVLRSEVASPLRLAELMLLENARTRDIFPGVAEFYRALQAGSQGDAQHPVFYLSGSPWNLYDLLVEVFDSHAVPRGPLLLTCLEREVIIPKLTGRNVLQAHKFGQIAHLLATYPAKRFILLGDSSQRDPEIYQQALAQFPGRIAAIYIRDVTGEARDERVIAIGHAIQAQGVPFAYAGETRILSDEAKRVGLIKA